MIVGVVMTGMYQFTTDLADSDTGYNINVDDDKYLNSFNRTRDIESQINDSYNEIQEFSANTKSTIGIITLVPEVLILLKNMAILPFAVIGGIIESLGQNELLGLPSWMITFMLSVMVALILFAIAALILRFKDV